MRYFAYGSNMSSARLESRVGPVQIVGVGVLDDYRHAFNKHGSDGTAKGNVEPVSGAQVWGVVYELSDDQFEQLDVIEGGYRRIDVEVDVDGETVSAITYTAIAPEAGLRPTAAYLEAYERGIREHEIPPSYWEAIRPRSSATVWIVLAELAVVAAIGAFEFSIPRAVPLLIVASVSLWIRDRSWTQTGLRLDPGWAGLAAAGIVAGAAAQLMIGYAVGAQVDDAALAQAGGTLLATVVMLHVATAFATEMVFRGYLVERMREVSGSEPIAIAVAAAAFAWVVAGADLVAAVGAVSAAIGYSLLYRAAGRSLVLPIAVHAGFTVAGAVLGAL